MILWLGILILMGGGISAHPTKPLDAALDPPRESVANCGGLGFPPINTPVMTRANQEFGEPKSRELQNVIEVIQGLRNRRLFDLADRYTDQMLGSESISTNEKASIVLEEIQTKVAQAIDSTGRERGVAWKKATEIVNEFKIRFPDHPQLLLVEVQDALVYYSHGNLIQQEIAAEIESAEQKSAALEEFRKATAAFKRIERVIEKLIPVVASRAAKPGEISAEQLTNLKNNIRYRLATVNLAKAQLFDSSDQLNRIDALNQVLQRLDQVITQSGSDVPLWWKAQIARATCFRVNKDESGFAKLFSSLPESELSSDLTNGFFAERIQGAIDFGHRNQFDRLLELLPAAENPTPQLQLAVLELLMLQASYSSGDQKRRKLADATSLVKVIENTQGPYWGRRAEVLLVGSVDTTANGSAPTESSDFEILVRQGESAFRKKNFAVAAKAFEKALQYATNDDLGDQALQLAVRFASCHESLTQHEIAAGKLMETSLMFREIRLADAVHLRGCWNLGRVPSANAQMIMALNDQIETWPDSPSTDQARLWLGSSQQSAKNWSGAIGAYNSIPFNSSHALAGTAQIEPCALALIADLKREGKDWKKKSRALVESMQIRLQDARKNERWNESQQNVLAAMLDIGLPARVVASVDAIQWLDSAVSGDDVSDAWRIQSGQLRLLAVSMDSSRDPIPVIKNLPNDAIVMRGCFDRLKRSLSEQQFDSAAAARVMICDKAITALKSSAASSGETEFWQIERLVAKVATSDAAAAVDELKAMSSKYPNSLKVQLAYGRALTKSSQNGEEILKQWRRLAAKVPKESDSWYEAKYNVAAQLMAGGQRAEAEKLIKYLKISASTWNQSNWKIRFENLLRQ